MRQRWDFVRMNKYSWADRINASDVQDACRKEVMKADTKKTKIKSGLFSSMKECEDLINAYFEIHLKESGEVADIESLADFLGTTRDEMMAMMSDKKYGRTLKLARNRIAKIKKQLAFGGKIPAAVLSFDLKNNHGYRDKPEDSEGSNHGSESVVFKGKAADWAQ